MFGPFTNVTGSSNVVSNPISNPLAGAARPIPTPTPPAFQSITKNALVRITFLVAVFVTPLDVHDTVTLTVYCMSVSRFPPPILASEVTVPLPLAPLSKLNDEALPPCGVIVPDAVALDAHDHAQVTFAYVPSSSWSPFESHRIAVSDVIDGTAAHIA